MSNIVGISLKKNGKVYYFDDNNIELSEGMKVVVNSERGKQLGFVVSTNISFDEKSIEGSIETVERIATEDDINTYEENKKEAVDALDVAHKMAKSMDLPMRFVDANFNLDKSQLIFTFVAESRIDFRDLAKNLASEYKTRIELRQIGVRDKAKEVSGLGQCGRPLCCASFLNDLDSVSINMAKNQNLALNPTKINGQCGRLLCCLKYEDELYFENKKGIPSVGKKVKTDDGEGKVISTNILQRKYTVLLENGNTVTITLPSVEEENNEDTSSN